MVIKGYMQKLLDESATRVGCGLRVAKRLGATGSFPFPRLDMGGNVPVQ